MDIQTILDYQSLDFEKVKINRQLAKSEEYTRYMRATDAMKKAIDNVAKMSTRAAQLFAKADEIAAQFEAVSKEYDEIAGAAEGLEQDLKRAEFYEKSLENLAAQLEQLEREANAVATELSALRKDGEAEIAAANKNASIAKSGKSKVEGAYGAKGIGELAAIPTAPAIRNAYFHYDGKKRYSLPLEDTPYSRKR